ncbi:hypothetical protein FH972_025445 [Carpinus fangiana]|uniref:Uncharacterized protein n=1 Tax=Carpinus fangiana TaxID=176857 RepID=A0A5N6L1G2_9ROSI|nr:hypothetical protein FH972_025445 [Carpinus fangiana]
MEKHGRGDVAGGPLCHAPKQGWADANRYFLISARSRAKPQPSDFDEGGCAELAGSPLPGRLPCLKRRDRAHPLEWRKPARAWPWIARQGDGGDREARELGAVDMAAGCSKACHSQPVRVRAGPRPAASGGCFHRAQCLLAPRRAPAAPLCISARAGGRRSASLAYRNAPRSRLWCSKAPSGGRGRARGDEGLAGFSMRGQRRCGCQSHGRRERAGRPTVLPEIAARVPVPIAYEDPCVCSATGALLVLPAAEAPKAGPRVGGPNARPRPPNPGSSVEHGRGRAAQKPPPEKGLERGFSRPRGQLHARPRSMLAVVNEQLPHAAG